MPDRITFLGDLPFIQVPFAIPFSSEIVLVFSPCNAAHEMRGIPFVLPSLNPLLKAHIGFTMVIFYTVHNRDIRPDICNWFPRI